MATAVAAGGGVKCWGNNTHGQLGDGTINWRATPVDVVGLSAGSGEAALPADRNHTCALLAGGVNCWRGNWLGQLGDGTTTDRSTPVDVVGLPAGSGMTAIGADHNHTCALVSPVAAEESCFFVGLISCHPGQVV